MSELVRRLIEAASCGDLEMVASLLRGGIDVHAENDYALRIAAKCGRTATCKALLDAGADVHAREDDALRLAAAGGHTETCAVLEDWMREALTPTRMRRCALR